MTAHQRGLSIRAPPVSLIRIDPIRLLLGYAEIITISPNRSAWASSGFADDFQLVIYEGELYEDVSGCAGG